MLEKLELTKNVQFYKIKNDDPLRSANENVILNIFNVADDNIEPEHDYILNKFRDIRTFIDNDIQYRYSIKIFPTIRPVYFIRKEIEEEGLYDRIYAFIIIFEFDDHICIIKKSCANITDKIEMNFDLITSAMIADTFNDSDVSFQRISMRNMTVSEKAIRNRSYEAADLKGTFSTHAAGRSIPLFLKYRQGSIVRTISGTGRLVESSHRVNFDDLALWAYNQLLLIKDGSGEKDFLDAFAKQKNLQDVLEVTSPNAILIESASLYDQLIEDSIQIKYVNKKGKDTVLNASQMNMLFKHLERVYTINSDKRISKVLGKAFIRVNNKTLTFDSSFLRSLKVNISGSDVTLQSYIIKNGFYSITFNDPRYMYFIGNCFQDDSGISEINSILDMLTPVKNMSLVKTEKGSFRRNSANFSRDSMFYLVENKHKHDDYVFCDDLGTEWADHITFNKKDSCINFIHSKHGPKSTSASNLHDVIGQAVKNLGYLNFSQADLTKKIHDKLSLNYNSSKGPTQIKRARKGNIVVFDAYMTEMLKDYKLHRKCILSCSFISKSAITTEFKKIQKGDKVNGHITQLLCVLAQT